MFSISCQECFYRIFQPNTPIIGLNALRRYIESRTRGNDPSLQNMLFWVCMIFYDNLVDGIVSDDSSWSVSSSDFSLITFLYLKLLRQKMMPQITTQATTNVIIDSTSCNVESISFSRVDVEMCGAWNILPHLVWEFSRLQEW